MFRHPFRGELEEVGGIDELALRAADQTGGGPIRREVRAEEHREVVLTDPLDDALAVVEAVDMHDLSSASPATT